MIHRIMRHKLLILSVASLAIICIIIACSLYLSKYSLTCTKYVINTSIINSRIRVVQLTDLHNSEFGNDNIKLINRVKEEDPDLICITGDMLNMNEENVEIATNLISTLSENYLVYISLGNHEYEYKYTNIDDLKKSFEKAGAFVLDFDYQDVNINGEIIRIGGFYGYGLPKNYDVARDKDSKFLAEFQNTDNYKLLLTHMPYGWYQAGSLDYWDVDLVLAGHTHGGQIRIPFLGGLYAPDVGWFPGKEEGLYYSESGDRVMVLSRGLGSTEKIPRLNNVPEIVVVDIIPE